MRDETRQDAQQFRYRSPDLGDRDSAVIGRLAMGRPSLVCRAGTRGRWDHGNAWECAKCHQQQLGDGRGFGGEEAA